MSGHVLDNPVWAALSSRQSALATGDGERARRFRPEFGPLTGVRDAAPESLAALAGLPLGDGSLAVAFPQALAAPRGLQVASVADLVQMLAGEVPPLEPDFEVLTLGDADAAEMLALAHLTAPGPFATHTHRLSAFIGVRVDGHLAAMAGERLQPTGFAEVSGVCTHPDHRGRGYAAVLSTLVARRIQARGETAFLHTYGHNETAIRLYERLGFRRRTTLKLTILQPA
jgi:ribosomal protein S18 acetylase RimI-like enzyme